MAFAASRLPVIWDFGVEAQFAAGKTAEQWVATAEQDPTFTQNTHKDTPTLTRCSTQTLRKKLIQCAMKLASGAEAQIFQINKDKIEQILHGENNGWVEGVATAPFDFNFGGRGAKHTRL